jgi:hypothetical protein
MASAPKMQGELKKLDAGETSSKTQVAPWSLGDRYGRFLTILWMVRRQVVSSA